MRNKIREKIRIILLILMICSNSVFSQSLAVFDVDASSFPVVKAKFFAFDKDGNQITNLFPSDFELTENGEKRNVSLINCPAPKPPVELSAVLTIDVSGSMSGLGLNIAKSAAGLWVNMMPDGKGECAVTSFDDINYLNQDFTSDKNKLFSAINSLNPKGSTDYDFGFINPSAGGLLISQNGKYKKVMVFLTDGYPNQTPKTNEIIAEAKNQGCTVYSVVVGISCPPGLKKISEETGGYWYENVTTIEQAKQIYQMIMYIAQGGEACEITWVSNVNCIAELKKAELRVIKNDARAEFSYKSPASSIIRLDFNPTSVYFENPVPGVKVEKKILVTAKNANFKVTDIISNNPAFTISPKSFILNIGDSRELTISYIPTDSGYVNAKFEFINDNCLVNYYASGGWKGKKPTVRTLKVIHPNGGEVFVAGSDTIITWDGVSPDEPVRIEYRSGDNEPWITIAETARGLSYPFNVPKIAGKNYLIRITAKARIRLTCDNPDLQICEQFWMGCNLDVEYYRNGDPIRHCQTKEEWIDAANKKEGAWCYQNNDTLNGKIYGRLYNWYAVNDPRGLAPSGWHIPTDAEWTELENCLGGASVAGGKLKSTGTIDNEDGLWRSPNTGATDESGFSALPGGWRDNSGMFYYIGGNGGWWTATEGTETHAWLRDLNYYSINIGRFGMDKGNGMSVRCVRD